MSYPNYPQAPAPGYSYPAPSSYNGHRVSLPPQGPSSPEQWDAWAVTTSRPNVVRCKACQAEVMLGRPNVDYYAPWMEHRHSCRSIHQLSSMSVGGSQSPEPYQGHHSSHSSHYGVETQSRYGSENAHASMKPKQEPMTPSFRSTNLPPTPAPYKQGYTGVEWSASSHHAACGTPNPRPIPIRSRTSNAPAAYTNVNWTTSDAQRNVLNSPEHEDQLRRANRKRGLDNMKVYEPRNGAFYGA